MADPADDREGGLHGDRPCAGEDCGPAGGPSAPDDLVARIRSGNHEAEAQLVAMYLPRVRRLIVLRTGEPDIAKDLSQDVIVSTLEALRGGRLRQAESLSAFVQGVTRNTLSEHYRSRARRSEVPILQHDHPVGTDDGHESGERRRAVHRSLRRLKPVDRIILHLLFIDGLTMVAIAERLRLSPETVRQRKARALQRIRSMVQNTLSI